MSVIGNYRIISDRVNAASHKCGRNPSDIKIIAVSKTVSYDIVQQAIDSGITLFGESRIQEAKNKLPHLHGSFKCHMIGHLQSNKAADAVEMFELIHSIDKASTAEAVSAAAGKKGKTQKILIQVKTSAEDTKSGISPEDSLFLAENILKLTNIELLGVMTIGPVTTDMNITRRAFRETASALERINNEFGLSLQELSMGMSGDFDIAIEEGASMLRIGSSIFGERLK